MERSDAPDLPQFQLPSDPVDRNEVVGTAPDPVSNANKRPSVRIRRIRPASVKTTPSVEPEKDPHTITAEVEAQDILIETYAEPQPRSQPPRSAPPRSSRASIPPAYVRSSEPRRPLGPPTLPAAPQTPRVTSASYPPPLPPSSRPTAPPPSDPQPLAAPEAPITRRMLTPEIEVPPVDLPPSPRPAMHPAHETPSLAPVAMAPSPGLASRGAAEPTMQLRRQRRSPTVVAALAILLAAVLVGGVVGLFALVPGARARTRSGASALVDRARGRAHHEKPALPAAPPPSVVVPVPVTPVPVTTVPSVAVDALPKSDVEPNMTLVTLPASANGHRIFVDGRVVSAGAAPITTRCGKHKVQIGSSGKPRVTQLPCGGEIALD